MARRSCSSWTPLTTRPVAGSSSCPRWGGRAARAPLGWGPGPAPTPHPPPQVSVDIFKGFPDEESIVNYTLNQAYQDNVTVFASELVPLSPALPPLAAPAPPPVSPTLLAPCARFPSPVSPHLGSTSSLAPPLVPQPCPLHTPPPPCAPGEWGPSNPHPAGSLTLAPPPPWPRPSLP